MPKVGLATMPMWATGKNHGFTLLEVLAVIVLLGLVSSWVLLDLFQREERTTVNYVQRLLTSDLKLAVAEAKLQQTGLTMIFKENGYQLELPGSVVTHDFSSHGFSFVIPIQATAPAEGETSKTPELTIKPDGSCQSLTLHWKTAHGSGDFIISENGNIQ